MNQEAKGQKKAQEEKTQGIDMKRAGRPEEIGKLAVFLVFFRFRLCHGLYLFDGLRFDATCRPEGIAKGKDVPISDCSFSSI